MNTRYALAVQTLQDRFGEQPPLQTPMGLPTGFPELDRELWSQGLPRGVLSLFISEPGLGATSLWLEAFRGLQARRRAALWISEDSDLYAPALLSRGLDLKSLYVVRTPRSPADRQFILREALESQAFTLIGCELRSLRQVTRSLAQLRSLVRKSQCAFVFLSPEAQDLQRTHDFGFVAHFQSDRIAIPKSKNRPSFTVEWRGSYAHLLPELSSTATPLFRRGLPDFHAAAADARARGPAVRRDPADPVALSQLPTPA